MAIVAARMIPVEMMKSFRPNGNTVSRMITRRLQSDSLSLLTPSPELTDVVKHFQAPIRFAAAYGSGAFHQKGYDKVDKKAVVSDFIFAVDSPAHWHALNIEQNPHHYSFLRLFGPNLIATVQDLGAQVYYNSLAEINGKMVKYGVVSTAALLNELKNWNNFYLSGRMQKPVAVITGDVEVEAENLLNRSNALRTSLLLLPESFTEDDLLTKIVGLSYTGDFRMTFGENPKKIQNIVDGQREAFRVIYEEIVQKTPGLVRLAGNQLQQDASEKGLCEHFKVLPNNLQLSITSQAPFETLYQSKQLPQAVESAITKIVKTSSRVQSLKGILTAGPLKSLRYVQMKLGKRT